jgi:F-type H+-transporting ATPase subunit b
MTVFLAFAESSIQLVPDGTLFFHVLVVVAMIVVLNRTLYRPVNKILAERELQSKGRLTEAQKAIAQTEEKLSYYERSLREARAAGYRLMETERVRALASRERVLSTLREEVRSMVSEQKGELLTQAERARETLETDSQAIAVRITEQILARSVSSGPR